RRRGAADRHRRPHAGVSARGDQARARTIGDRADPGAQPSLRRSDALAGRYPDDEGDRRYRHPARHFRARPHHRRQERACEFEGDAADIAIACIYHLLTIRFALWRTRERVVHRMRRGWLILDERGSMMNQHAERMWVAALSMSPGHLVDKFLDWLEELRGAMALAEIDRL